MELQVNELFPLNDKGLRVANTNSAYQSTFLPLLQDAETKIKKMIILYFWLGKPNHILRLVLLKYITEFRKKLPKFQDQDAYINGLMMRTNKMIDTYYEKANVSFLGITQIIKNNVPDGLKLPKMSTPKELVESLTTHAKEFKFNMWAEAKASVRVKDYPKQISNFINQMAKEPFTTSEEGKKPISIWQKAEMDIRHEKQMEMIENLRTEGVEYAWISSHPDCSKRCEKWQGKLMNISKDAHSELSGFRMKEKVDGNTVYCFQDIISQVDKYGYTNNVVVGFNCRHHLIKYIPHSLPPKEYSSIDIKRMRDINAKIKEQERAIRLANQQSALYNGINDRKSAEFKKKANKMTINYKSYCERNGFQWEQYRIGTNLPSLRVAVAREGVGYNKILRDTIKETKKGLN